MLLAASCFAARRSCWLAAPDAALADHAGSQRQGSISLRPLRFCPAPKRALPKPRAAGHSDSERGQAQPRAQRALSHAAPRLPQQFCSACEELQGVCRAGGACHSCMQRRTAGLGTSSQWLSRTGAGWPRRQPRWITRGRTCRQCTGKKNLLPERGAFPSQ